jgi:signal peptidase I
MSEKRPSDERSPKINSKPENLLTRRPPRKGGRLLLETLIILIVAFALVFGFVRPFVAEAYEIPSGSMVPTLEIGDRVLANKFIYRFHEPNRGDIVVFESVENQDQTLIKRVVGLPGDEIQLRSGTLFVNSEPQNEPYLNKDLPSLDSYGPVTVPEGKVFVMGDNRGDSADSRVFGPLPIENIEGEAFLRFWPLSRIGPL